MREFLNFDFFGIEALFFFHRGFGWWKQGGGRLFQMVCGSGKIHEEIEWAQCAKRCKREKTFLSMVICD